MTRRTLLSTAAPPIKLAGLGLILCMTSPGHAIDDDRNTVHPMTILTLSRTGAWGAGTHDMIISRSLPRSAIARPCQTWRVIVALSSPAFSWAGVWLCSAVTKRLSPQRIAWTMRSEQRSSARTNSEWSISATCRRACAW